jgi:hypothetical protein
VTKKKLTKREEGRRLNEEGRTSPLEGLQVRFEYYLELARAEMAKGEDAMRSKIHDYLKAMQEAAVELAPYRHPRLQATAVAVGKTSDLEEFLREIEANDRGFLGHLKAPESPNDIIDIDLDSDTQH